MCRCRLFLVIVPICRAPMASIEKFTLGAPFSSTPTPALARLQSSSPVSARPRVLASSM